MTTKNEWLGVKNQDRHARNGMRSYCFNCNESCMYDNFCDCCKPTIYVRPQLLRYLRISMEDELLLLQAGRGHIEILREEKQ